MTDVRLHNLYYGGYGCGCYADVPCPALNSPALALVWSGTWCRLVSMRNHSGTGYRYWGTGYRNTGLVIVRAQKRRLELGTHGTVYTGLLGHEPQNHKYMNNNACGNRMSCMTLTHNPRFHVTPLVSMHSGKSPSTIPSYYSTRFQVSLCM